MRNALKAGVVAVAALLLGYLLAGRPEPGFGSLNNAADRKPLALALPALDGSRWSLAQERGNIVLVNFWATWCPPCRMETPELVRVANGYAGRGVKVVGVSMDEQPERAVPAFVSRFGIPYPILLPSADSPLASSIESLPTSLLVDRNGRVARTYLGAVDERILAHDIDQLLAEQTP
jgi:cytochrome c biogenesis protein CcmG/thiol:disulfide interchange protein DsbE